MKQNLSTEEVMAIKATVIGNKIEINNVFLNFVSVC